MDSVRDLLIVFFKIAVGLFVIILVAWLSSAIPRGTVDNATRASSTPKSDFLPSPRKYSGFFSSSSTSARVVQAPILVTPEPFSYGNSPSFVEPPNMYGGSQKSATSYNTYITQQATTTALQETGTTRNQLVRNLSIYEGGIVYTGLSFVGEARSSMFREGKFPIIVVDSAGKIVGVSAAVAQTSWTVPGWVRFETRIGYALPNKIPCKMIFEEALTQAERTRAPARVAIPVRCN